MFVRQLCAKAAVTGRFKGTLFNAPFADLDRKYYQRLQQATGTIAVLHQVLERLEGLLLVPPGLWP